MSIVSVSIVSVSVVSVSVMGLWCGSLCIAHVSFDLTLCFGVCGGISCFGVCGGISSPTSWKLGFPFPLMLHVSFDFFFVSVVGDQHTKISEDGLYLPLDFACLF